MKLGNGVNELSFCWSCVLLSNIATKIIAVLAKIDTYIFDFDEC